MGWSGRAPGLMGLGKAEDIENGPGAQGLSKEQFAGVVKKGGWDAIENEEFVHWLHHEQGFDGIIEREGVYNDKGKRIGWATNYGIFKPTQIKSATGNKGTFDPTKPDISDALFDFDPNEERNAKGEWTVSSAGNIDSPAELQLIVSRCFPRCLLSIHLLH